MSTQRNSNKKYIQSANDRQSISPSNRESSKHVPIHRNTSGICPQSANNAPYQRALSGKCPIKENSAEQSANKYVKSAGNRREKCLTDTNQQNMTLYLSNDAHEQRKQMHIPNQQKKNSEHEIQAVSIPRNTLTANFAAGGQPSRCVFVFSGPRKIHTTSYRDARLYFWWRA